MICRILGHMFSRGRVVQGDDVVAEYCRCRWCGTYHEKPINGWTK